MKKIKSILEWIDKKTVEIYSTKYWNDIKEKKKKRVVEHFILNRKINIKN